MNDVAILLKDDVVELLNLCAVLSLSIPGAPLEDVGEGVPALWQGLRDAGAGPQDDVEDPHGGVGEVLDRVDAVALAGDDLDGGPAGVDVDGGDLGGAEVPVSRLAGLEALGEIDPQLQADVGLAVVGLAGHLCVHDAPAGRHELQVARVQGALVAGKVLVVRGALEQVRDGLLAAVRVVGEPCAGRDGEVVEHEEGREVAQLRRADGAADARACALGLLDGQEGLADGAGDRHF